MRKKRRGSTILLVLMVSTVMIILSAVISSALVFTTRGINYEKIKADYMYAAEGGLELGIQKYNELGKEAFLFGDLRSEFLRDNQNGIDEVVITYETINEVEKIVSTVYSDSVERFKICIPVVEDVVKSSADILKNSIYSSKGIKIDSSASAYFERSNITYNEKDIIDIPNGSGLASISVLDSKKPEYYSEIITSSMPELNIKILSGLDNLWNIASDMNMNVTKISEDPIGKIPNGIGRMVLNRANLQLESLGDAILTVDDYKLIIVDTPKLTIELPPGSTEISKTILICSGEIEFKYVPRYDGDKSTINMSSSTIYGDDVKVSGNAVFTINYAPAFGENSLLIDKQLGKIDELLNKYLKNWGAIGGDGAGRYSNIKKDEIEYYMY